MNKPLAFRGTYSDWRLVKTRGVVQVILEVPLADADAAYQILGGMPDASKERWFAVAPLAKEVINDVSGRLEDVRPLLTLDKPAAAKRDWRDLGPAQQAGIRCEESTFIAFLTEERPDDWYESDNAAECVRLICGVQSRSELATNQKARVIWHQLDDQYQAWMKVGA